MDTDNEAHPLLYTYERESWRKSLKRRCFRIPSELTVTGLILGLFLLVVTLFILLEKFKSNTDTDVESDNKLLASPFKYNKKAEDKSWQEKKDFMKSKNDFEGKKFDNIDKGWKKFIELASSSKYDKKGDKKPWKDKNDFMKSKLYEDKMKYFTDKGWQKLIDSGWNKGDLKEALFEAWKDAEQLLESSITYEDTKSKSVDDSWEKAAEDDWTDMEAFKQAWEEGENLLQLGPKFDSMKWKKVEDGWKTLSNKSVGIPSGCPYSKMLKNHALGAPIPQEQIDCALIAEEVRKSLGRCIDLSFLPKRCKPSWRTKCFTTYKYRKIDGTCNNKIHPKWGKSGIPFVRMIEPNYSDGASSLPKAKSGKDLPNARLISRTVYSKKLKPDSNATMLFLNYGLFLDHDMVQTAVDSNSIPCCADKFQEHPEYRPKECLQIDVQDDDPFYSPRNVKCLNLVRSVPVHGECVGRREQLNKATSFLDGSAVYGSMMQQMKDLRSFSRGQLRTQLINNAPYMAYSEGAGFSCGTLTEPLKCFEAGDPRVNMLIQLTSMHTLWYREHNRIATELHKLNPQWTDEMIFQEARRILIAELQHIAYNEFLPLLLGEKAMDEFQLKINKGMKYEGYDDTLDPSIFNVFGAAAFRFGHSLAQGTLELIGPNNTLEGKIPLHETFFNLQLLYHNGLDDLLRGEITQQAHSVDSYITPEVREHLFQPAELDYGHDLAAVGIQRGRDHGLPPYIKWRSVCGLSDVNSWEDLRTVMDPERVDALQEVYESVDDIDLIPGALAENHVKGALLGPTYQCLIGRQFKKSRKGDRFWFENQDNVGSFPHAQLNEIYNSNMARIVCDNSDNIQSIQKHPFKIPSEENPIVSCNEIPRVDLSKFSLKK